MHSSQHISDYLARRLPTNHVLFEKCDGLYWTEGRDLDKLGKAIGFRCDGDRAGFDSLAMSVLVAQLTAKRYKAALANGTSIELLRPTQPQAVPPSQEIRLDPTAIYDKKELVVLASKLKARTAWRERLASLTSALLAGDFEAVRDLGRLYVYRICEAVYEVDWQLTGVDEATVQTLATAALQANCPLVCYEVDPRRRLRGYRPTTRRPSVSEESMSFGQLKLAFPM